MYCFRCGKKLPPRVVNCPECDTPQKRRQRYRRRMILGLFIFLAGAIAGSLFDTLIFKGKAWDHSFVNVFSSAGFDQNASASESLFSPPATDLAVSQEISVKNSSASASVLSGGSESVENKGMESQPSEVSTSEVIDENATSPNQIPLYTFSSNLASESSADLSTGEGTLEAASESFQIASEPATEANSLPGKIVYDKCQTLVKGSFNSYHGFVGKNQEDIVFASDEIQSGGKSFYQCFLKKNGSEGNGERVFEWPGNVWTPEISPDGNLIVFSSDSRSPEHIFVYDRQTKKSKALTMGNSKNMMPAISPDGKLIAYVSSEKGNNDIWLIGTDGSNKIQITQGEEDDREPRWLPDGRGLVFTRIYERLKKSHIMKIMLDPMGDAESLISDGGRNWLADMAPDGKNLAFVRSLAPDGSKNTIFVKNLETNEETSINPLTSTECFRPVWVPDNSGFVFHANVNKNKNIYKAVFKKEIGN